jgi:poly(beta-D-mannuronate) lyase
MRGPLGLVTLRVALAVGGLIAVCSGPLAARDHFVEGPGQLPAALKAARAGDTVTLKNGPWNDVKVVVNRGGEPGNPVVIRAETPGGVKLGGASSLEINAAHVTVDGFWFHGGAITKGAVIQFKSHHGVVRNTAITDYNPASFETEYYWVFFDGDDNRIERCFFKGKNHLQPLIGNAIVDSRRNAVSRSYFKNVPYVADVNGREIIRVWGSGKLEERDEDGAYFTIEHNLFDRADGEGTEIISLKSNHNVVRHNTVIATRGGINIRRGNFNTVEQNVVLGQGIAGAQGLRMSGRNNVVRGNFVSGCGYGIRVACGEFIASALTPSYVPDVKPNGRKTADVRIPTYPQVKNLTLSDNVLVGISGPDLEVGSSYKNHWPESQQILLPEGCVIENNRFVRSQGGASVLVTVAETAAPLGRFTFKPNTYRGNFLVGSGRVAGAAQPGFASMAIPADWSEANERAAFKPLTAEDVGPEWVIALRRAGQFAVEDTASAERAEPPEARKNKRKR